jgi:3-oxoacyl-[acyl-carrier-protein] synthase III
VLCKNGLLYLDPIYVYNVLQSYDPSLQNRMPKAILCTGISLHIAKKMQQKWGMLHFYRRNSTIVLFTRWKKFNILNMEIKTNNVKIRSDTEVLNLATQQIFCVEIYFSFVRGDTIMPYQNVKIMSIGTYHPTNCVHNEYYIQHFKKLGMDNIEGLLGYLGRENRYITDDENENTVTMGVKAAEKALENANITADDLDMIVFVSDTPEYTAPTNALKIHNLLQAKNAHVVYDTNANCVGIITAIDQVSRYLKTNKRIRKALVVGSVLISAVAREDDPLTYACFADSGAAVLLENREEEVEGGFIDSVYRTDSSYHDTGVMPACGLSRMYREDISIEDKKWKSVLFDASYVPQVWTDMITELLDWHSLKPDDVDHFIFSQFAKPNIDRTLENLKADADKATFIAHEYGYTGVTSPIFALERAVQNGNIRDNSNIVLCSIGTGYSTTALLYRN